MHQGLVLLGNLQRTFLKTKPATWIMAVWIFSGCMEQGAERTHAQRDFLQGKTRKNIPACRMIDIAVGALST